MNVISVNESFRTAIQIIDTYKSFQYGLLASINAIFQTRFQDFNCFSLVMAETIESHCSNQTS